VVTWTRTALAAGQEVSEPTGTWEYATSKEADAIGARRTRCGAVGAKETSRWLIRVSIGLPARSSISKVGNPERVHEVAVVFVRASTK